MGRSIALCIGVDQYEDEGISDLNCAERDASKLAYTLESLGFEAESLSKDVSADLVFRKLRAASRKLESEEDLLVFFFAGHGKTVQQGNGSDQLLLLPSVSSRVLEQGIVHGAPGVLSYRALVAETAHLKGKRLFMFDACRLPILTSESAHRDGSQAVKFEGEGVFRGIALSTKQKGVGLGPLTILNSCSDGQRAEELAKYPGGGHGAMTAALLELLKEIPKAGRSLKLNGEYVTGVLKERMGQLIREYGSGQGEQIPYLQGEEITLYQPEVKVGPSEDERLWLLAESEDTIESYQRYIREAPEARYAKEASERIKALRAQSEEDKAYAAAHEAKSLEGWRQFKVAYPESVRLGEVEKEIVQLEAAEAEAKAAAERKAKAEAEAKMKAKAEGKAKAAAEAKAREELERKAKEEEAWKAAKVGGLLELKGFLEGYPASRYRGEAENLLKGLQAGEVEKELWKIACSQDSGKGYLKYLMETELGLYVDEAKARIEALKKPPPPPRKANWLLRWGLAGGAVLVGLAVLGSREKPAPELRSAAAPEATAAAPAREPVRPELPSVEKIDGWSADRVKGLQRATALALGLSDPQRIKECTVCPEMVLIPAGRYTMGSPEGEADRDSEEGPQHEVRIGRPLLVGKYEVTFGEWDACVSDGACQRTEEVAKDEWGRGRQPVMRVTWEDINEQYLPWLNRKAGLSGKPKGEQYRLLSESEWEYAARAGTTGPFNFEGVISPAKVNYDSSSIYGGSAKDASGGRKQTVEVGSLPGNRWGLHEMHGNVWEWVEDCWNDNYNKGAPDDGSAWQSGDCERRVVRGGSWYNIPRLTRAANRDWDTTTVRSGSSGFRVARMLP